ncbi:MAG: ABC transporter permease [Kiritimatiellae bacterium]|nr:ABC transporter permease [Kiritimatiellia bacterium]
MKPSVKLALGVLLAFLLAAVYGEVQYRVAQFRDETPAYNRVDTSQRYLPPSAEHWLGTDNLGRPVSLRLVQGARIAFVVGVLTSCIAIPLGVLLGLAGGYFGGKTDSIVLWLCATVASMPGLLFILAISLVFGQGMLGIVMGVGFTTWVGVCRTVRAEVIKHKSRAYVQAARILGYSHLRIMFRHILPNVAHIVLIQLSIRFPSAVSTEVFISFLGIGIQGEPSWGVMINNARLRLWQGIWWEMAFTTLCIFLLVLAFNHLADYLRDRLDPALRSLR